MAKARLRTEAGVHPSSSSSSAGHNEEEEEGLLAAGPNAGDEEGDDGDDDGLIALGPNPGNDDGRNAALLSPASAEQQHHLYNSSSNSNSNSNININTSSSSNNKPIANGSSTAPPPLRGALASPRTPRTPNRVRFDLRPTIVNGSATANGNANGHGHGGTAEEHYHYARESFDLDDDDPLAGGIGGIGGIGGSGPRDRWQRQQNQHQRLPLLTDIEAPSIALANSRWGDDETENGNTEGGGGGWGGGGGRGGPGRGEDAHAWAEAERARPKSGLRMAFMNMANSIIGAGIIGQPYAFRQAGLLAGVALLAGLTVVVDWTIRLIVINSKLSGASSFQGTVERCFGRPGLIAVSVAQWAFAFGGMVAFGVIVGDSIPHVLAAIWPGLRDVPVLGLLTDRRAVIVVFTLGVSYPLTLYRDIAKLAKASTLALVSMSVIVVTVVVQGILAPSQARGSLNNWHLLVINDGIFQAIGVISFAFVCHHNSLLIYGSLKTPTIDRFARVTHYSTGVSMVACMVMALAGFLTFGDRTLGNVLNNFPADNTMVNVARLCFGLNMLTTLPLEAFVCREVMLNFYFPGEPFNMNLHLLFSTSLVVAAMCLSLVTCDLGAVFELVGATSAAAMAYILPPLCYIKLTTRSWKTYVAAAVAAFGCIVMGISMLQAVGKMIKGQGGTVQCM